ncbi:hypothetical protein [Sorangium sp. So ce861]|uniref:hypothetical protein n=1 Tax=Sorangium sp. So ce861 TaxID=3133323 RepID=UPI003F60F6B1
MNRVSGSLYRGLNCALTGALLIAACRGGSNNSTGGSGGTATGSGTGDGCEYTYGPELLRFPTDLDSLHDMPPDVCPPSPRPEAGPCGPACPGGTCDQASLDRLHNIFAWRLFVAANWPHTAEGADGPGRSGLCKDMVGVDDPRPSPQLSGAGLPLWCAWRDVSSAFRRDEIEDPEECQDVNVKTAMSSGWTTPLPPHNNPVWDQNGNPVKFEARMNPRSYEQFVSKEDGFGVNDARRQLAAQCLASDCKDAGSTTCAGLNEQVATWGRYPACAKEYPGGVNKPLLHIKLAWKKLGPSDDPGRFLLHEDGEHGLVAMHIAAKTLMTKASWFWATFEHVDNLEPPEPWRKPLFRDPSCLGCAPNTCPKPAPGQPRRTQIERLTPIPRDVADLNAEVRALFEQRGHVLQQYQLIGAQRRESEDYVACSLSEKPTHVPLDGLRPAHLANAIIEWDRQDVSCFECHARAKGVVFKSPAIGCAECGGDTCPSAKEGDARFGEGCADFFWQAARAAWDPIVNTEQ